MDAAASTLLDASSEHFSFIQCLEFGVRVVEYPPMVPSAMDPVRHQKMGHNPLQIRRRRISFRQEATSVSAS